MDISVVIPAYNSEKWISRAIKSVLNQTVSVSEIIVVDDGSTDSTAEVVRKYEKNVRYIYQDNSGPSVARNRGINEAKCEWIAFLDSDDEWLSHKIECQTQILEENKNLYWCGSDCKIIENGSESQYSLQNSKNHANLNDMELRYFSALIKKVLFITSGLIIKKEIFKKLGYFNIQMHSGEDIDLWCRIAMKYPQIGYCFKPCWLYHQDNPDSAYRRGKVNRDLPVKSFCINMRRAMELGPDVANEFYPYAKKKVMDNLLRFAARDCTIEPETIEQVKSLFHFKVYERYILEILRLLPKPISLRLVGKLRGKISL